MSESASGFKAVMGIDAAWTERAPSGVALIGDDGSGWKLFAVASSYAAFLDETSRDPERRHTGSIPEPAGLLEAAKSRIGFPVDLVAIDMPMASVPITGRRSSDDKISAIYGARHASTHTPSAKRPGRLSDDLRLGFERVGYPLAVAQVHGAQLAEVYPHPALIELAAAPRRLPYKYSKIAKYWPDMRSAARRESVIAVWSQIIELLEMHITGVAERLLPPRPDAPGHQLKAFEDALDAVVCAWVGTCVLNGRAQAFGDEASAIWVPMPRNL